MDEYYSFVRREIAPLLPPLRKGRVLDIGCGNGDTSAWLKKIGIAGSVLGVERVPEAAEKARRRLDEVVEGDAEAVGFGDRRFDLCLCLDILEHMVDPWAFMERIGKYLAPGGVVIASIPNLRNYRVMKELVLRGRFEYRPAGILDRTHLRFFTRHSACRLMETGGLRLQAVHEKMMRKKTYRRIDRLTFGIFRDFFVSQFLLSSTFDPENNANPGSPG
jgi:2-polyprenyl-3-methyl-5-hydroxy-6-metoxy-1,4-benzoquinol methylase